MIGQVISEQHVAARERIASRAKWAPGSGRICITRRGRNKMEMTRAKEHCTVTCDGANIASIYCPRAVAPMLMCVRRPQTYPRLFIHKHRW